MNDHFSEFGLAMATLASVSNAFGEIVKKRIVNRHHVMPSYFAYRTLTALFLIAIVVYRARIGTPPNIVDAGQFFGLNFLHLSPGATFTLYIITLTLILGYASWLQLRAFQLSQISTVIPLLAFTPVFLLLTGWIGFGEIPVPAKILGVLLIVAGTFGIHADLLSAGWLAPLRAVFEEKGSRYMLGVALIFALTNPMEKRIVLMSGPWTEAVCYGAATAILFLGLSFAFKEDPRKVIRDVPALLLVMAIFDTTVLVSQFSAQEHLPVVIAVSIKRTGILLVVFLGWLVFKESDVGRKLLAAAIMVMGAIIIYLPMTFMQALGLTILGLAVMIPLAVRARTPAVVRP